MKKRNERGVALITVLLLMVVLTVIGLGAITVTSLEVKTAQNERQHEEAVNRTEGGNDIQVKVLEETLLSAQMPEEYLQTAGGPVVETANLSGEIFGIRENDSSDIIPDLQQAIGAATVKMDIDFLYRKQKTGSALEMAGGYEGIGFGGGSGGTEIFYQLESQIADGESRSSIVSIYDCVVIAGCQK